MACHRSIARALAAALCLCLAFEPAVSIAARNDSAQTRPVRGRTTSTLPEAVATVLRASGLPECINLT